MWAGLIVTSWQSGIKCAMCMICAKLVQKKCHIFLQFFLNVPNNVGKEFQKSAKP